MSEFPGLVELILAIITHMEFQYLQGKQTMMCESYYNNIAAD